MHKQKQEQGFTLVELAIVLVIIGLIIGGIVAGAALIHSAELQSVIRDINNFSRAVNTFQLTYNALPGDMDNATSIWGTAAGGCPYGTGTGTCNGDGNGYISSSPTDPYNTQQSEEYRAWQQLSEAGYINGTYTGITGGAGWTANPGVNVPLSRLGGGGYSMLYMGAFSGDSDVFDGSYGHAIVYGRMASTFQTLNPVISVEDALALDTKIDDGKPGMGNVLTFGNTSSFAPHCADASPQSPQTANYDLTQKGPVCTMVFKMGF
jgi:prepilin-type N-terminal cleavage/methylation domain-containing protein